MDRRKFVMISAAGLMASRSLGYLAAETSTSDLGVMEGKDPMLTVVTRDPLVLETPDSLLRAHRMTPSSALFVRNHHGSKIFESMKPRPLEGHLEIGGLVRSPRHISLKRLGELETEVVEMVLQCSGNFRSQFSKVSPIKGTPWNKGGVGNVRFGGIPLARVFEEMRLEIHPSAKYLAAEGADQPENDEQADYEKSVPLKVALERGLLATTLNGELLPAVHGGPLRLIIPGYYGSVQVKWLTRLRLEATESSNQFQIPDYRTPKFRIQPGEKIDYTFENSDPNLDLKINSRLLSHSDGDRIPKDSAVRLRGVAWNDGAAPLTSVEVSLDAGTTWRAANLNASSGPYAFHAWSLESRIAGDTTEIWIRATDELGRCQSANGGLAWNPGGYCWSGYDKVAVIAE
jgi:sulfite oxidase